MGMYNGGICIGALLLIVLCPRLKKMQVNDVPFIQRYKFFLMFLECKWLEPLCIMLKHVFEKCGVV